MTLYAITIFLSAFLLFQVQPLIAKIILPWFGGSAAVWSAALLFFQLVLLAGYAYAHFVIARLRPKLSASLRSPVSLGMLHSSISCSVSSAWVFLHCVRAMLSSASNDDSE